LSPSGRLLAIGHASGNWKTALWDLEGGQTVWEADNEPHTAPRLLFSPDEKHLIGHEYGGIVVYTISTGRCLARHTNCAATHAAMHPSGLLVVGNPGGKLILMEPRDDRPIKTLRLGRQVDKDQLDTLMTRRPGMESAALKGSEQLASLLCSPDGRWLFCGVQGGLRVYDWEKLTAAKDTTPAPAFRVDIAPHSDATRSWPISREVRIEALALDATANLLLFAGTDGIIRCLDLSTGNQHTLLNLPETMSVGQMELSLRQQYLCCTVYPPASGLLRHSPDPTLQVWKYSRPLETSSVPAGT
jgi:WD40 repeat protein